MPYISSRLTFLTIAMVTLFFWTSAVQAQFLAQSEATRESTVPLVPDTLTKEQLQDLMSRLSDEAVREILLDQLAKRTVETENNTERRSEFIRHTTTGALDQVEQAITSFPRAVQHEGRIITKFLSDLSDHGGVYGFTLRLIMVIAFGYGAERAVHTLRHRMRRKKAAVKWEPARGPLAQLTATFLDDVIGLVTFVFVALLLARLVFDANVIDYAGTIFVWLVAFPRIISAVQRFWLAPERPMLRIAYATDITAQRMMFHMTIMFFLLGALIANDQISQRTGLIQDHVPLAFWLNLAIHVYIIVLAWVFRRELTLLMRGRQTGVSRFEDYTARAYPYFAITLSVVTWWIVSIVASYGNLALLASAPHYKTMLLLLVAPVLDTAIREMVFRFQRPMVGEGAVAERAYRGARRSYIRIGRLLVFALVLLLIADIWNISLVGLASAGVGVRFAADVVQFFITVSFGYLIYEVVSLWINQRLAAEITATGFDPDSAEAGGDGGGVGGSRLSTVLPLLLNVSRGAILIVFLLLALGNAGLNITPLLAGAGIVGLAIGFGAQKLVSDVVSGVFFLIDDAFRIAEYVEVEGTMGTVEKISVRSMQLRHHKGPVHTIPYGAIPQITNYSRDWVIMKLRFTVPFDSDPNKVKKIFKKIGQDMLQDPILGEDFLQPFKSQGVLEIDDVGMVIRGKFMAKPGKQFMIRKEIYNRVSAAFAENGIPFARREVRVTLPDGATGDDLSEEQKKRVSAAASAASPEGKETGELGKSNDR